MIPAIRPLPSTHSRRWSALAAMTKRESKLVYRFIHKTIFDSTEFPVNSQPAARFQFDFLQPLPIQIEVSDTPRTSEGGPLPLRQFDQRIRLTRQSAAGCWTGKRVKQLGIRLGARERCVCIGDPSPS
jgi:hypothetical protein